MQNYKWSLKKNAAESLSQTFLGETVFLLLEVLVRVEILVSIDVCKVRSHQKFIKMH